MERGREMVVYGCCNRHAMNLIIEEMSVTREEINHGCHLIFHHYCCGLGGVTYTIMHAIVPPHIWCLAMSYSSANNYRK